MTIEQLREIRNVYRGQLLDEMKARLSDKGVLAFKDNKPPFVRHYLEIIKGKTIYLENGELYLDGFAGLSRETAEGKRPHIEVASLHTDCLEILLSRMMGIADAPPNF